MSINKRQLSFFVSDESFSVRVLEFDYFSHLGPIALVTEASQPSFRTVNTYLYVPVQCMHGNDSYLLRHAKITISVEGEGPPSSCELGFTVSSTCKQ